ncbi:MAG TPA: arabinofuranosidase catalytic domain-containing protein [Phycisphaerae bacterium]|nr:arabinofuranosidase catalytic domain-containing protein [Phycisphaerae bacterium]
MNPRTRLIALLGLALVLPPAALMLAQQAGAGAPLARPQGPCDIYAAAGDPCTAAHSSTRALYAAYNGPLYQVMRQSDNKTLDIGVVQSSASDAGGYADAAAQDAFCANTTCWITTLYDQSGHGNNLTQPPHGGFSGPAMGGFDNLPIADAAPITIMGHKAYGVFIQPGMGLRWNDAHGTAVDDQAEGQYWVVDGTHYNGGCCYDYGNAETDSHDDGDGTMETAYFGSAGNWYHGPPPGPWIMTDQENNLVGCVTDAPNHKLCADLPIITWRFVAATADAEPHHWRTMGGDAQQPGDMAIMFDGPRVQNNNHSYDPMRKQGAILLGNGGDNSNGSDGTFYEGAMTAGGTFPTQETDQKLHANIVAAHYDAPRVRIAPASAVATPPGLQTFAPGSSQDTTITFTNSTGAPATNVELSLSLPNGWTSDPARKFNDPVAPGASVSATFKVTSGRTPFNGDLLANATWSANGQSQSDKTAEKIRNVSPIRINEFSTNFIELYNASSSGVDISNWTLTEHAAQQAIFSAITLPPNTKLAPKGFYLLSLADSGLAVPAGKGDTTIHVRSFANLNVGDTLQIDTGSTRESRTITALGTPAGNHTTLWQPLPDGPVITIPVGSTNIPVASTAGIAVGEKIALGYGNAGPAVSNSRERYEIVTVTAVGKPGSQTLLTAPAKAGDTTLHIRQANNISPGDQIRLDIDSKDHGIETVTVKSVEAPPPPASGPASGPGRGFRNFRPLAVELTAPLKFNHSSNMPLSVRGTGISFTPATAFVHASNEPIQPLGTGITLDKPLDNNHDIDAVVEQEGPVAATLPGPWPQLLFGGPIITNSGSMVLRDSKGLIVDSLNFGAVVDPWAAEGFQGFGCSVPSPVNGRGGRGGGGGRGAPQPATAPNNRSVGRTTDGADTDSNCEDFTVQTASPGASNQK